MDWLEMRKQVLAGTYKPLPKGWKVRKGCKPPVVTNKKKHPTLKELHHRVLDQSNPLLPY